MADGLCSDGKTVSNIINEKSINSDENLVNCQKLIKVNSVECANNRIERRETQKYCLKRDLSMTATKHQQQQQQSPPLPQQPQSKQTQQQQKLSNSNNINLNYNNNNNTNKIVMSSNCGNSSSDNININNNNSNGGGSDSSDCGGVNVCSGNGSVGGDGSCSSAAGIAAAVSAFMPPISTSILKYDNNIIGNSTSTTTNGNSIDAVGKSFDEICGSGSSIGADGNCSSAAVAAKTTINYNYDKKIVGNSSASANNSGVIGNKRNVSARKNQGLKNIAAAATDVDLKKPTATDETSCQETDDSRIKKKRCSDRYDSSESSDRALKHWYNRQQYNLLLNLILSAPPVTRSCGFVTRSDRQWKLMWKSYSEKQWIEDFRVSKSVFTYLCEELRPILTPKENPVWNNSRTTPLEKQIAVTLYKLASCAEYRVVGSIFGIHKSTVKKIVYKVVEAIITKLMKKIIVFPNKDEAKNISTQFEKKCHLPQIIGCIDGTHIPILAPAVGRKDFLNRKGWTSIIMQAVVDDNLFGVATLSCTDSSTASSDASDPGSPYSPVSLGDDVHQTSSKGNMPPQILQAAQIQHQQQQKHQQKQLTQQQNQRNQSVPSQWPWNHTKPSTGNINNNQSCSNNINNNNNNNNSAASGKLKRISSNLSDINVTAKKVRTVGGANNIQSVEGNTITNVNTTATAAAAAAVASAAAAAAAKRLKPTTEESQTKITGYFKSQMKSLNGLKKDLKKLKGRTKATPPDIVNAKRSASPGGLDKFFNLFVKDEKNQRVNQDIEVDVRTLTTMSPSLKRIERKNAKVAQVAPISRKTQQPPPRSPKKHVAIAPRTADHHHQNNNKQSDTKTVGNLQQQQQIDHQNIAQPTVLLTAIRIPPTNGQQQQQQSLQQQQQPKNNNSSTQAKVGSVFQIPVMPNLVQIPNILTTNRANLVVNNGQLARMGNGAQYFLNGTVIKLQQFQTATTTPNNVQNGSANHHLQQQSHHHHHSTNGVLTMESGLSGNILVKPPTIAQSVPFSTASTKATLPIQQQPPPIVSQSQINGNIGHSHHHQFATNQRYNTTQSAVFMATSGGLLLNTTTLPAVITTSKLSGLPQAMPALHPIQPTTPSSNLLPSISNLIQAHQHHSNANIHHHHHHHHQQQQQQQHHNHHQQYIVSQHQQIVSNIPHTSLNGIVVSRPCSFSTTSGGFNSSMAPALVTFASIKDTLSSSVTTSSSMPCNIQPNITKLEDTTTNTTTPPHTLQNDKFVDHTKKILSIDTEISTTKEYTTTSLLPMKFETSIPPDLVSFNHNNINIIPSIPPSPIFSSPKEVLRTSLPSPKSLVLEQIQQKSPPEVFKKDCETEVQIEKSITEEDDQEQLTSLSSSSSSSLLSSSCLVVDDKLSPTIIEVDNLESTSTLLPECAISPILSQPKTIRFPVLSGESAFRFGPKGTKRHDGVCYWDKCNEKFDTCSKLLDHMQTQHVNTQSGPFACLWSGCKVHGRQSCSRRWLERHVLSHGGTKPFKCIVDGCGLRFGSQLALQKHVNGHFNTTETKDNPNKRASDPPIPKLLRKNGKKLRYRRQPFSARMFDFFDSGVMEGLQHRLLVTGSLANGPNGSVTFQGRTIARRVTKTGSAEIFVRWNPSEIISDEWIPETNKPPTKTVTIHSLQSQERIALEKYLGIANLNPDISSIFNQQSSSVSASISSHLTITNGKKHSRKPPKRTQPS